MQFIKSLKQKVPQRSFLPAFILVFNSLTWYTLSMALFTSTINSSYSSSAALVIFAVNYTGVAGSALLGSIVFPRARRTFLFSWVLGGTLISAFLITVSSNNISGSVLTSFLLGVSVGIGLPSCLAYFADETSTENRGFHGGVTWSAIGFGILLLALLVNSLSSVLAFLAIAIWRALGLGAFAFMKNDETTHTKRSSPTYFSILRRRDLTLYLIPWIMFCLVNFVETPMLEKVFGGFFVSVGFIEFALTGFFALIGGALADIVGRKRVIMTGFIILGLEYAILSLFYSLPVSWYVYTAFDGIAWGMFASVFFMTLWGDLANGFAKEKYYLLGGLSYILSGFLPILVKPYVEVIPLNASFSLASFFLFLAVLPLMYAPETLPEKRIRERELKEYVERAKKAKEKYA